MLDDKLRETDWEITDETIREQVAKESYAQWLQDCQKKKRRTPVRFFSYSNNKKSGIRIINIKLYNT